MSENIFADEWRECLQAHYMHVISTGDHVTQPSLTIVMQRAGFSEAELAEFRVRATMHVDDVGGDFVPDLDVLAVEEQHEESPVMVAVPALPTDTASELEAVVIEEQIIEEEVPPADELEAPVEEWVDDEPEDDPDMPQQLSLF
jgi:hypothetical protein